MSETGSEDLEVVQPGPALRRAPSFGRRVKPPEPRPAEAVAVAHGSLAVPPWRSWLTVALGPVAVLFGAAAVIQPEPTFAVLVTLLLLWATFTTVRRFGLSPVTATSGPALTRTPRLDVDHLERVEDRIWTLRDREARFRETLDWQTEIILRRSADGRLNFVNRAFCTAFGVDWDDVIGTQFRPPVLEAAPDPSEQERIERILTVRGPRWFAWDVTSIPSQTSAPDDVQLVGRDVTENREVARTLADARDAAEAANRAKTRFLAAMSHEIRTPMNGILGLIGLLERSQLDPDQHAYLRGLRSSADYLKALLNDILDFSRIEAGQLELCRTAFELPALVDDAVRVVSPKASAKDLSLETIWLNATPPTLVGDPLRLRQILINLLDNAVKFTERGGVRIEISVGELPTGDAERGSRSTDLQITVIDTGRGLAGVDPERLFEEFERAIGAEDIVAAAANDGLEGAGLGLSISRRLATAMDGTITAENRSTGGAAFTLAVVLPHDADGVPAPAGVIAEDAEAPVATVRVAASEPTDFESAENAGLKVLIVEDNPVNAVVARVCVERMGYRSETLTDGLSALQRLKKRDAGDPICAVLLDLKLPGLCGLEVMRRLQTRWAEVDLNERPFMIALTAHAFSEDRERCLAAGFDAHLAKPFEPKDLEALLERAQARASTTPVAPFAT